MRGTGWGVGWLTGKSEQRDGKTAVGEEEEKERRGTRGRKSFPTGVGCRWRDESTG